MYHCNVKYWPSDLTLWKSSPAFVEADEVKHGSGYDVIQVCMTAAFKDRALIMDGETGARAGKKQPLCVWYWHSETCTCGQETCTPYIVFVILDFYHSLCRKKTKQSLYTVWGDWMAVDIKDRQIWYFAEAWCIAGSEPNATCDVKHLTWFSYCQYKHWPPEFISATNHTISRTLHICEHGFQSCK